MSGAKVKGSPFQAYQYAKKVTRKKVKEGIDSDIDIVTWMYLLYLLDDLKFAPASYKPSITSNIMQMLKLMSKNERENKILSSLNDGENKADAVKKQLKDWLKE